MFRIGGETFGLCRRAGIVVMALAAILVGPLGVVPPASAAPASSAAPPSSGLNGWGGVPGVSQGPDPNLPAAGVGAAGVGAGGVGAAGVGAAGVGAGGVGAADEGATELSTNWSGYSESGSGYTAVSATWKVPAIPASSPSAASQWVGIDGATNSDLIQAGTSETDLSGKIVYFAWFEILPSAATELGLVAPGDEITVKINQVSAGKFSIVVEDVTSGAVSSGTVAYSGPLTSAEWIAEDPQVNGSQPPLADFGSTTFTNAQFTGPSASDSTLNPIEMVNSSGSVIAEPGAISNAGFTVTYTGPKPVTTPGCPATRGPALGSAVGVAAVKIGGCVGYLITDGAGQVSAFGAAKSFGDLTGTALAAPIISITATPDGRGYWLLGADGGIFSFGDAKFFGSMGGKPLNAPVVSMAPTPDGRGYWLVAKDGGIFSFGDAKFHGSTGNLHLNQPVDGIAVGHGGTGYWLVASDGGVFAFDEPFVGSLGAMTLNKPIVGMSSNPDGNGYTLVGSDGGVFTFNAPFDGSLGSSPPPAPIVALSPVPGNTGYYLIDSIGQIFAFGSAVSFGNA